jgi:hypothetical protein
MNMNRADKARKYLSERLDQFVGFKNMADSKQSFFDSIIEFRKTILIGLSKFDIFNQGDIEELRRLFTAIEMKRGKGETDSKVYHSSWDEFGKIQAKINELIAFTESVRVPWYFIVQDFICSKGFIISVSCVFLASIIQLILYFLIFRN